MAFKTYTNLGNDVMAPITSPVGAPGTTGWEPSVLYMLVLVAAEIFLVAWIHSHL
jgi:hypothetical protein